MTDTRFSIAIHLLILISEADAPLSSAQLAKSVGTNPSFVRKILGALKNHGLIYSRKGRAGFALAESPKCITLLQVYQAVYENDQRGLFGIHKTPNDACIVGRHIQPTLDEVFGNVQREAENALGSITLAECITTMEGRLSDDERPRNEGSTSL